MKRCTWCGASEQDEDLMDVSGDGAYACDFCIQDGACGRIANLKADCEWEAESVDA